jgi:phosphoserine aminotransferase
MIPMNLLNPHEHAGYLITGIWSQMALNEAQKLKNAYCVFSEEKNGFQSIPQPGRWELKNNTSYLYYTPNETVNGVRFSYVPTAEDTPLIAEMTSCLLSEPINISQYGLIFAGAQKNIANAGLTLVIVRDDLLEKIPNPPIPTMLDYKMQTQHHSLYATPPVFNCYLAAKMFHWIKVQGGIRFLYEQNCQKADKLYQFIDSSDFYKAAVDKDARSLVNICFSLRNPELENKFIHLANQQGLRALKGHRLVGGLRASLYNAMPMAGVDTLIDFMYDFAKENSN